MLGKIVFPRRKLVVEISRVVTAGLLGVAQTAFAQAPADTTLRPVTVRAERVRPDASTNVVTSEQLEKTQAKDLREALQNEPGVTVGGGGAPIAQKIYIRGVEDTLLNVSVDGAQQNGYIYHHQGRVMIDPQLIKSIEVEKGTASATAGPGALAGAIRFTTKDARDMLRPGQQFGALLGAGYSTNDSTRWNGALYGRIADKLDLLGYIGKQDISDYEDGDGQTVQNSASEQDSRLFKLGWDFAEGHRFSASYNGVEEEGVRFLRPHMVAFGANNVPLPSSFQRDTFTAGWQWKGVGAVPAMDVTAYSDDNENLRTNAGRTYGENVTTRGADVKLTSRFSNHKLEYGLNHAAQEARAINPVRFGIAGNRSEEDTRVTGVFVQDTVALGDHWLVSLGGRYDSYDYTDNHNQKYSSDDFSPSGSVRFQATKEFALRAGYAESLRGVGLKETFLLDNGPGPLTYRNDADIDAEEARNIELGAEYEASNWGLRASLFELTIDNYIQANVISGQARRYNAGTVKSRGYELAGDVRFGDFTAGAGVAYAKPRLEGRPLSDGDFGLGTSYGRTWNLNLGYTVQPWNMAFGWTSRYVESRETTAADNENYTYTKDGYDVHDIHVSWLPLGKDTLRLRFAIKNVFDKFYYDQASYAYNAAQGRTLGLAEPGRDIRLDVSYKF